MLAIPFCDGCDWRFEPIYDISALVVPKKHFLKFFWKILKKCFLVTDRRLWVMIKWLWICWTRVVHYIVDYEQLHYYIFSNLLHQNLTTITPSPFQSLPFLRDIFVPFVDILSVFDLTFNIPSIFSLWKGNLFCWKNRLFENLKQKNESLFQLKLDTQIMFSKLLCEYDFNLLIILLLIYFWS